jgi:hypothetical protein|nr:hypothetical protein [Stenotrophomonas pavanii]
MHNHPLRLLYFTLGPGLLALAAIAISAWYASHNRLPATTDTTNA